MQVPRWLMCGHMVMSDHGLAEKRCGVYTWSECRCIKAVCTWHRQKHWLSSVCIFCYTARGRAVNHAASGSSRLMKGDKLQTFPPSLQPSSLLLLLCCCIASRPHSFHLGSPLLIQRSRHLAIDIIFFLSWHLSFFNLCVLSFLSSHPPSPTSITASFTLCYVIQIPLIHFGPQIIQLWVSQILPGSHPAWCQTVLWSSGRPLERMF